MAEKTGMWEDIKNWGSSAFESAKKFGNVAVDKSKEYADKAQTTVEDYGKQADDASGGWLGNNKGLLIGGAVALFALFGMEGGIMPMLLAVGALIAGVVFMDKDKGIFHDFFGKKNEIEPSGSEQVQGKAPPSLGAEANKGSTPPVNPPAASKEPPSEGAGTNKGSTPPVIPPTGLESSNTASSDTNTVIPVTNKTEYLVTLDSLKNPKSPISKPQEYKLLGTINNPLYIKQGSDSNNLDESSMLIYVNKDGKVTGVAVTNKDNKFDMEKSGNNNAQIIITEVSDKTLTTKKYKNGAEYIDFKDEVIQKKLQELREIGTNALGDRSKNKNLKGDLGLTDAPIANLGTFLSPNQVIAKVVTDKSVNQFGV